MKSTETLLFRWVRIPKEWRKALDNEPLHKIHELYEVVADVCEENDRPWVAQGLRWMSEHRRIPMGPVYRKRGWKWLMGAAKTGRPLTPPPDERPYFIPWCIVYPFQDVLAKGYYCSDTNLWPLWELSSGHSATPEWNHHDSHSRRSSLILPCAHFVGGYLSLQETQEGEENGKENHSPN